MHEFRMDMRPLVERAWEAAEADPITTVDLLHCWTGLGMRECIQMLRAVKPEDEMQADAERSDAEAPTLHSVQWTNLRLVEEGMLYDTGRRRGGRIVWALTDAGRHEAERLLATDPDEA